MLHIDILKYIFKMNTYFKWCLTPTLSSEILFVAVFQWTETINQLAANYLTCSLGFTNLCQRNANTVPVSNLPLPQVVPCNPCLTPLSAAGASGDRRQKRDTTYLYYNDQVVFVTGHALSSPIKNTNNHIAFTRYSQALPNIR